MDYPKSPKLHHFPLHNVRHLLCIPRLHIHHFQFMSFAFSPPYQKTEGDVPKNSAPAPDENYDYDDPNSGIPF